MSLPIELQLEAAEQVRKQHDEQMRKQHEGTAHMAALEESNTSLAEACHRVQGDYLTLQGDYASLEVRLAQSESELADLKRQLEEARKDTGRLDLLQNKLDWIGGRYGHDKELSVRDFLDEAIDAAQAAGKERE